VFCSDFPVCLFFSVIVVALAVALQVQVTLFRSEDYFGLRINLADFLIPILGLLVLGSLFLKKTQWPQFYLLYGYVWIVALVGVMSVSFAYGYWSTGVFSSWGFVNKYCGFLILVAYFMLGAWVARNVGVNRDVWMRFLSVFCGFFVLMVAVSCVFVFFPGGGWLGAYPWDGLMANRNAFMVVGVFAMVAVLVSYFRDVALFPAWASYVFWFCVPFFAIYNASRAGWIMGAVFLLILLVRKPVLFLKRVLPFLVLGSALVYATVHVVNERRVVESSQYLRLKRLAFEAGSGETSYDGDQKRFIAVEDGLELYGRSNPLLGAGLGGVSYVSGGKAWGICGFD